jgi:hypothetical protein
VAVDFLLKKSKQGVGKYLQGNTVDLFILIYVWNIPAYVGINFLRRKGQ